MELQEAVAALTRGFATSTKMLAAIGDETRQHIMLEMMQIGRCSGVRVGEITQRTNLSRPAVSHHLKILKEAGIVKVRKEGTKNYYYFAPETEALDRLIHTLQLARALSQALPDREEAPL